MSRSGRAAAREVEASRQRLVAALTAAQSAMTAVLDRAAEHEALLRGQRGRAVAFRTGGVRAVDGGVLLAWVAHRVTVAAHGPGDRLACHLRYFAGQRFLHERPDGLVRGVPRPREVPP